MKNQHVFALSFLGLVAVSNAACTAQTAGEWRAPAADKLACDAWAAVPHRTAVYFNNVWNVQAAGDYPWIQCVVRDPSDTERLGFYWKWPDSGGSIFAQPQAKIGMSPWAPVPRLDQRFPIGIRNIEKMRVATRVQVEGPSEYNIVTTLWLTNSPTVITEPRPDSIVAEVMIWTYATAGHLSPAGRKIGTVTQGGTDWDIWLEPNWHDVSGANDNRWVYVALVAKEGGLSAEFDPVALLRSEPLKHLNFDNDYIADVELGAEVMRGESLLWIDRFDVSIDPK